MAMRNILKSLKTPKAPPVLRTVYQFVHPTSPGIMINLWHESVPTQPAMHEDMNWTAIYRTLIQNGWRASKQS
jgi:hypothetical protein